MTITLTAETIFTLRVAAIVTANEHADKACAYVEQGLEACAAQSAQHAFRYSRAWHEIAFSANDGELKAEMGHSRR